MVSDSLCPHGLQHARLPYPPLTPRVCSDPCPLSWWCHLILCFPFFFCPQSFPASGSFPMIHKPTFCEHSILHSFSGVQFINRATDESLYQKSFWFIFNDTEHTFLVCIWSCCWAGALKTVRKTLSVRKSQNSWNLSERCPQILSTPSIRSMHRYLLMCHTFWLKK